jgi:hypothetical protein
MGSTIISILDVIADIATVISFLTLFGLIIRKPEVRTVCGLSLKYAAEILIVYLAILCCVQTYHMGLFAFIVSIVTAGIGAVVIILVRFIYTGEWGAFFLMIAAFAWLFLQQKLGERVVDKQLKAHYGVNSLEQI